MENGKTWSVKSTQKKYMFASRSHENELDLDRHGSQMTALIPLDDTRQELGIGLLVVKLDIGHGHG